jgi:hypothetical protein
MDAEEVIKGCFGESHLVVLVLLLHLGVIDEGVVLKGLYICVIT